MEIIRVLEEKYFSFAPVFSVREVMNLFTFLCVCNNREVPYLVKYPKFLS